MTRFLLKAGAKVNSRDALGYTPLAIAADTGNYEVAGELLRAGADPAAKSNDGETAEEAACGRSIGRKPGHDKVCQMLKKLHNSSR